MYMYHHTLIHTYMYNVYYMYKYTIHTTVDEQFCNSGMVNTLCNPYIHSTTLLCDNNTGMTPRLTMAISTFDYTAPDISDWLSTPYASSV